MPTPPPRQLGVEDYLRSLWYDDGPVEQNKAQQEAYEQEQGTRYHANQRQFYGGGGLAKMEGEAQHYNDLANAAASRGAYQIDYANANADRDAALASGAMRGQVRGDQMGALAMMRDRASGKAPSIAQMQATNAIGQVGAEQSSAAASARGAGGLAAAQTMGAANARAAGTQIANQSAVAAAQERLAAEQAYMGGSLGIGGQDIQAQQAYYQGQGLSAQQAQAQGQMEMSQRGLNQQGQMGYEGMRAGVYGNQMQSDMGERGISEKHWATQSGMNQESRQTESDRMMKGVGTVASGFAGGMMSDVTSKANVAKVGGGGGGRSFNFGGALAGMSDSMTGGHMLDKFKAKQGEEAPTPAPKQALASMNPTVQSTLPQNYVPAVGTFGQVNYSPEYATPADTYKPMVQGQIGYEPPPMYSDEETKGGLEKMSKNDAVAQLAEGLAPYAYDYKPGYGTPGRKVGPMAQNMVDKPLTKSGVIRDEGTGKLAIDRDEALKIALGGVGLLAAAQMKKGGRRG